MPTRRQFLHCTATALSAPIAYARAEPRSLSVPLASPSIATPLPESTGSDVGSLFPFIQAQAKGVKFPLSFLHDDFKDVADWKRRAREKLMELLHYEPPACNANPEVVERIERDGLNQEKVYFNTTPDHRVAAYVLIPKNVKKPMPAIVALHDHGGFYLWGKEKLIEVQPEHPVLTDFRRHYYGGNAIADTLARQGYVVIVIDMFYWGERRMLLDNDPDDWRERPANIAAERIAAFNQRASQSEQLVGRTIFAAGFTWAGIIFWDDIRTVDYLVTRPEVDSTRIGCVGLSVGGLRACHLAALDDRIKAAVVVGWMASFPAQLRRHIRNTIGHTKLVPGLYRHMDYPDVASLAMPGALLVIQGSRDALFEPDGVQVCFDKLHGCYAKAGIPERFRAHPYDAPHEFNAEMQTEAWEWLRRWV
jgi:dienelactone hydrolase